MTDLENLQFGEEVDKLINLMTLSVPNLRQAAIIESDIRHRLGGGVPYFEEVKVRKTSDETYEGTVFIGPNSPEKFPLDFKFNSSPFTLLDKILSNLSLRKAKSLAEDKTEIVFMRSGERIEGDMEEQLFEYTIGSIPYAIAYLEHQLGQGGSNEGTFQIPRAYDLG